MYGLFGACYIAFFSDYCGLFCGHIVCHIFSLRQGLRVVLLAFVITYVNMLM